MAATLVVGLVLGFVAAIPLAGPVALLIVSRAMEGRAVGGVFIGIGSATAEAIYAALAFWGFSTFLTRYGWIVLAARIVSAVILIVLGVLLARGKVTPAEELEKPIRLVRGPQRGGSLAVGFTLTLLNPTVIGSWAIVATTLFSMDVVTFEPIRTVPFGAAVGVGIGLWYFLLVELLTRFKSRVSPGLLPRITRWLGVGFIGVGVYLVAKLLLDAL
jgi:threonine/homoserine/homoserine lactone efflux protein